MKDNIHPLNANVTFIDSYTQMTFTKVHSELVQLALTFESQSELSLTKHIAQQLAARRWLANPNTNT